MSPIPNPTAFTTKANKRVAGAEILISGEQHAIPSTSPFIIRLTELPLTGVAGKEIMIPGFVETPINAPTIGQFYVESSTGVVYFNSDNATNVVHVTYWGTGSIVLAEDVNNLQTAVNALETTTGTITDDNLDFSFPRDVNVGRDLVITGDLTVNGAVAAIETTNTRIKDNIITLNDGAASGMDAGIEVFRGTGNPVVTFEWVESVQEWRVFGISNVLPFMSSSSTELKSNADIVPGLAGLTLGTSSKRFNKLYIDGSIDYSGDFNLLKNGSTILSTDIEGKLAFANPFKTAQIVGDMSLGTDDIGCIYYDSTTQQFKGIKDDGVGNPVIVILG